MKMIFNLSLKYLTSVGLISVLWVNLFFTLAYAQVPGRPNNTSFCNRIDQISNNILSKLNNNQSKLTQIRLESDLKPRQNLQKIRSEADKKRQRHYKKILEKARTFQQRQAVEYYQKSLEEAISERRLSVDNAVEEFNSALIQLVSEQISESVKINLQYQQKLKFVFDKVKMDCQKNIDDEQIENEFSQFLSIYQNEVRSQKPNITQARQKIVELRRNRQDNINNAIRKFENISLNLTQNLKKSFNNQL